MDRRGWDAGLWLALGMLLVLGLGAGVVGFSLLQRADGCQRDPAGLSPRTGPDGRPALTLYACGGRLYRGQGEPVRLTGVNWFGFETETLAPHGLWSRQLDTLLDQIQALGYNAIRLPYSDDLFDPQRHPSGINTALNPDLQGLSALELLDRVVAGAAARGLVVVLDRHRPTVAGQSLLWYTDAVDEATWIAHLVYLARRYRDQPAVIGLDLHNEPGGPATWGSGDPQTDWRLAAERAGNAVLAAHPYLLIFVQGVERDGPTWYWRGGNLRGAGRAPVRLSIPGRLVYSPHDYGPGVYPQPWFDDWRFPLNLPLVWDHFWGYLAQSGQAPVVIGEFGGRSTGLDREGRWQRALLAYSARYGLGFFAWSLNPNSADTGGVLGDDWLSIVAGRQALYQPFLAPPLLPGVRPAPLQVLTRSLDPRTEVPAIAVAFRLVNRSPQEIPLQAVEVRYWFTAGQGADQLAVVDWAAMGRDAVQTRVEPARAGGQDHVLVLRFRAGILRPFEATGEVLVRVHRRDWAPYWQPDDYSFLPSTVSQPNPRVVVSVHGRRLWGETPAP